MATDAASDTRAQSPDQVQTADQQETSAAAKPASGSQERRVHRRYDDRPLNIKIGKHKFPALDWSMGGFRFYPDGLELARKDRIEGRISGRRLKGDFSGEVASVRDNGEVGVRFHNISKSLLSALGGYAAAKRSSIEPSPLRYLWFLVAAAAFLGFLFLMV